MEALNLKRHYIEIYIKLTNFGIIKILKYSENTEIPGQLCQTRKAVHHPDTWIHEGSPWCWQAPYDSRVPGRSKMVAIVSASVQWHLYNKCYDYLTKHPR